MFFSFQIVLPKICSDEYDKFTCIFLGVQTEISVIVLDLTMVISHSIYLILFAMNYLGYVWYIVIDPVM